MLHPEYWSSDLSSLSSKDEVSMPRVIISHPLPLPQNHVDIWQNQYNIVKSKYKIKYFFKKGSKKKKKGTIISLATDHTQKSAPKSEVSLRELNHRFCLE